jgi:hypothetical protein
MCHTTPNELEKTWTYRRGNRESRLGLSWSPYHRKAGKNWSPKTLKINILLVKRSQKERPRLEMTRASRITCALKMSWKLKTAHRTIRCGMPWASQQGSILFLQRKLTKASGFFTPAELIWEAPTCGNFHKETWWQSSWFWGCLLCLDAPKSAATYREPLTGQRAPIRQFRKSAVDLYRRWGTWPHIQGAMGKLGPQLRV